MRAILQVQLSSLTTDPTQRTTSPADQINENLLLWNLGAAEPFSVDLSYPIQKGQTLFFTCPAGGGACNLFLEEVVQAS